MFLLIPLDEVLKDEDPLIKGHGEGELPENGGQPHLLPAQIKSQAQQGRVSRMDLGLGSAEVGCSKILTSDNWYVEDAGGRCGTIDNKNKHKKTH
jgi:hypothetical protein